MQLCCTKPIVPPEQLASNYIHSCVMCAGCAGWHVARAESSTPGECPPVAADDSLSKACDEGITGCWANAIGVELVCQASVCVVALQQGEKHSSLAPNGRSFICDPWRASQSLSEWS